jgi:hypothetical protein
MPLTLAQARALARKNQHPSQRRSIAAQVGRFYAQGYYMREDGRFYITVGGKEYEKYYTGA